jgi:hypothetical protein
MNLALISFFVFDFLVALILLSYTGIPFIYSLQVFEAFEALTGRPVMAVFDGRKAMFSPQPFPQVSTSPVEFQVEVPEDDGRSRKFKVSKEN